GPSQHMTPKYFSPEHLALIKFGIEEAAKRGMKIWIADEGSYPSGFAGGLVSKQDSQLCIQGVVAGTRLRVARGHRRTFPAPPDTLGAFFVDPATSTAKVVPIVNGQIKSIPPAPTANGPVRPLDVVIVRHM